MRFQWHPGMAPTQKRKNVAELHQAAALQGLSPLLEVSTKSEERLGQRLSAFNIKVSEGDISERPLESVYQGSKVFEFGGPFIDLYSKEPREAKRDPRLNSSGKLVGFRLGDIEFPLFPKTAFYDWLYIRALYPHRDFLKMLEKYAGFTDIEFNPQRSLNCQGRSCATFLSLSRKGLLEECYRSPESFIEILRPDSIEQPHSSEDRQGALLAQALSGRNVVFISHANPEDNGFTLWLSARLAGLGYVVWSDVTKLLGGEYFWHDIEELLRKHAVKVLSVVSPASPSKLGFRKELDLACTVEATTSDPRFIIPLLLKDGNFADLPIQIHGKIAIPFRTEWHHGLSQLVKRLAEDEVPRVKSPSTRYLSDWSRQFLDLDKGVRTVEEPLASNEIPVVGMPSNLRVLEVPTGFREFSRLSEVWPCKIVGNHVVAFAGTQEWQIDGQLIPLRLRAEVSLEDFLLQGVNCLPHQTPNSRRAFLSEILRVAWERFAQTSGLVSDTLANRKLCWFFPGLGSEAEFQSFTDVFGRKGKRQLGGEHKSHSWHYAIQVIPRTTDPVRFALKSHVTFSEDGYRPLEDAARKHSMRRRIAIMWWQDKWRDLLSAFLSRLAGEGGHMKLAVSQNESISVSTRLFTFVSPVSPAVDDGLIEPDADDEELVPEGNSE